MQPIWAIYVTGDQRMAPIWRAFMGLLYPESYSKYPAAVCPGHVNYQTPPKNIELRRPSALSSMPFDARARPWLPSRRAYRNQQPSFYSFHFLHTVGDCLVEEQMSLPASSSVSSCKFTVMIPGLQQVTVFAEVGNRDAGLRVEFALSLQSA